MELWCYFASHLRGCSIGAVLIRPPLICLFSPKLGVWESEQLFTSHLSLQEGHPTNHSMHQQATNFPTNWARKGSNLWCSPCWLKFQEADSAFGGVEGTANRFDADDSGNGGCFCVGCGTRSWALGDSAFCFPWCRLRVCPHVHFLSQCGKSNCIPLRHLQVLLGPMSSKPTAAERRKLQLGMLIFKRCACACPLWTGGNKSGKRTAGGGWFSYQEKEHNIAQSKSHAMPDRSDLSPHHNDSNFQKDPVLVKNVGVLLKTAVSAWMYQSK